MTSWVQTTSICLCYWLFLVINLPLQSNCFTACSVAQSFLHNKCTGILFCYTTHIIRIGRSLWALTQYLGQPSLDQHLGLAYRASNCSVHYGPMCMEASASLGRMGLWLVPYHGLSVCRTNNSADTHAIAYIGCDDDKTHEHERSNGKRLTLEV